MEIGIQLYLIKGMSVGLEIVELPESNFFVVDLFILRIMFEFRSDDATS